MSDELRPLVSMWNAKIKLAWQSKRTQFQDDADEAMRFFDGPYDFLYGWRTAAASRGFSWSGDEDEHSPPAFRMTVNKVAEIVQIFGPALYHRNPVRKVAPRKPPMLPIELFGNPQDPQVQQYYQMLQQQQGQMQATDNARSILLEAYLNYTPNALDLKTESRWAIDEALVKGLGILWTETYQPSGAAGMNMVGSFYDSVDNLLIDPDAETLAEARWIARRYQCPHWMAERRFGLEPDVLAHKSTAESYGAQSEVASMPDGDYRRRQGQTNDLVAYWCIWSKMGLGGRLLGMESSALRPVLEAFGDNVYLCVADNYPYPLNLPKELCEPLAGDDPLMQQMAILQAQPMVQWPTPYWTDDTWPFTRISFHDVPRKVWPVSHVKPGLGELKFLNWAFSFLAGKVRTACRDFIAVAKSSGEELKERIKSGPDYTMIEVDALHGSIDSMVKFLQHPDFNPEIYKVIEGVTQNFERRTGLTELAYGLTDTQIRSAQEAQVKGSATNIRPDDMANKVEDSMTELARKEALAARWHLKGQDVAPIFGPLGAQWWDQLVTSSNPGEIIHQLEYRIEANSAKKPNQALEQANMGQAMQNLFPSLFQFAMTTGQVGPVNTLIAEWAKSNLMDPAGLMLPAPPPPPPGGPPGAPPGPPGHPGNPGRAAGGPPAKPNPNPNHGR